MTTLKFTSSLLFLLVTIFAGSKNILACSCAPITACEAFNYSQAVFIGRPIQASQKRERSHGGTTSVRSFGEVVFEVLEPFSGVTSRFITVWSDDDGMCSGYSFSLGRTYLVYAYEMNDKRLSISGCSRTRMLVPLQFSVDDSPSYRQRLEERQKEYDQELAYLRNVAEGKVTGASIYGTVWTDPNYLSRSKDYSPRDLSGVKVKIEGEQQSLILQTDGQGRYESRGLTPGTYSIFLTPPDGYVAGDHNALEKKLTLRNCGCGQQNFKLSPDTGIRGRVVDDDGKPIAGIKVNLISADWKDESISDQTIKDSQAHDYESENNGEFNFESVVPSRYLLGVSSVSPNPKFPYQRTFYPGVSNIKDAEVITVEHGQKVGPFEIRLTRKLETRAIQGVVLWLDETPVVGASVRMTISGDYKSQDEAGTDDQGRFTLRALKDQAYQIKVYWHDDDGISGKIKKSPLGWQSATTEMEQVTTTENIKNLKLVLTRKQQ